eukprot:g3867.t1
MAAVVQRSQHALLPCILPHPLYTAFMRPEPTISDSGQGAVAYGQDRGCEPGQDTEVVREKVELVLRLKDMGRRFEWRGALKVFRRAKAGGMVPDNSVYSCIIGVVAKSGRWSEAVELLREARDVAHLEPNTYCYTAAVSACAKGRNWELALSLLDEMQEVGLSPDHVTYGSAVSAMARAGQWERALELLRRMTEEGLRPNVVCYGSAVDACAKGGQWERAVGLLGEMRKAGVEPDRICYNTAINACAQSGEWEIALGLSDEMRHPGLGEGARPDVFTFNSIMHGMASVGECERLLTVLDEMKGAGVNPDAVSYNTAMGACNKARQHQLALSTFEEMQAAGVTPDRETFSAAAEACACISSGDDVPAGGGGMGARAMELMRMARDQGLRRPAAKAVAATLAACVGGGPWRRAIPAVEAMLVASGRHAWDDVMNFLAEAQLGRRKRERQASDSELEVPHDDGAVVAAARAGASPGGRNTDEEPRYGGLNGRGGGSGACVPVRTVDTAQAAPSPAAAPLQAAEYPGRSEAQTNGRGSIVSPGKERGACTCVRLQTRPVPEAVVGDPPEEAAEDREWEDGGRRRPRLPRPRPSKTARGAAAAAAAASLKLGGVSALAAAALDQAS